MTESGSTLTDMFEASLSARAGRPALEVEHADGSMLALTFGDVGARAAAMAGRLAARGLRAGDRCVVHLANCVEFVDLFLACIRLGVIFVPANVLYRGRELKHIVDDSDPALIVTAATDVSLFGGDPRGVAVSSLAGEAGFGTETLDAVHTDHTDHTDRSDSTETAAAVDFNQQRSDGDPAMIIYTSGTTGRAKGAVLSRGNLAANAAHLVEAWRITSDDRYLAVLPLFHVHGLGNGVCSWLASGCLMRLAARFDATHAAEWFEEFRPTLFFGVPTIYVRMLEWDTAVATRIGACARLFVSGSAPLPAHVHEAFRVRFGHTILERYGMSETLMNIGNPLNGERRAGSVGVPFSRVEARVVNADGTRAADGAVGGLEVRGPNVFKSYWRNPEATSQAFRDGWFRTGDMAERASDGYFTLRGRSSDLIISGGFNIYPREIEEVLLEVAGVREVAVVSAQDPRRGEVPVAYVVADDETSDDAMRAACRAAIASFKVPRAFVRVDSLPRTALGKVQKHLLPPWIAP